jgi:hypothetical protein
MRTLRVLPSLIVLSLLALLALGGLSTPGAGGRAFADEHKSPDGKNAGKKDGKDDGKKDGKNDGGDDGGEFYTDETSFSGKQADHAINLGVAWLRKKQGRNGSWGGTRGNATYSGGQAGGQEENPAGPTALALYALLKCKQPLNDPVIRKGFDYLWKHYKKPESSYEVSMLLLAVCATADNTKMSKTFEKRKAHLKLSGRYRSWASHLASDLADRRTNKGWRYNVPGHKEGPEAGGDEDLSSTQLALLALFEAQRLGIKVKSKVWEDALEFTLSQQDDDGPTIEYTDPVDKSRKRKARARGFAYIKGRSDPDEGQATGGMTACGMANLEMCRFVLSDGGRKRKDWDARPVAAKVQEAIYDAIAWIERNWSPFENPKKTHMNIYHVYWHYALERAMDLLDLKLVGSHRWYNEIGQELINRQYKDGHWDSHSTHEPRDTLDTSFALLFLKRATAGAIPFGSVTGGSEDPPADNR